MKTNQKIKRILHPELASFDIYQKTKHELLKDTAQWI
jgi:hypothetical protein